MGRGVPKTSGYGPLWCEWFGVSASASAADNSTNLQAAFAAANTSGRPLFIGAGTFQISAQLLAETYQGFRFQGAGAAYVGGTILDWQGATDAHPILIRGTRDSFFGGFILRSTSTSRTMATGIQVHTGPVGTSSSNTFEDIVIHGWPGVGALGCGVEIAQGVGGSDANNDLHKFTRVHVVEYSSVGGDTLACGFRNLQGQAKAIVYEQCGFVGHSGSNPGVHGYHGHSAVTWLGGGGGYNSQEDFYIAAPNDPGTIVGAYSEESARFLRGAQGSQLKVTGYRWSSPTAVAGDRKIIRWFGSLMLEDCSINGDIGYVSGNLLIEANGFRSSYISVRGTRIQSEAFPISTTGAPLSYDFVGNSRASIDSGTEQFPDASLASPQATVVPGTDTIALDPSGYYRPTGPGVGARFFDLHLGAPIWWDGSEWVDADGATAGAAWTPADAGTLVGAWDMDLGVTESGGIVSAVAAAYGTSAGLAQATAGDRPTLIEDWRNGHAAIQGTDAADFLAATLGAALEQPCFVYLLGECGVGGSDTEFCGASDGNIAVRRSPTNTFRIYSGSSVTSGNGSLDAYRPFWSSGEFDGASSRVRGRSNVGGLGNTTGNVGANDGTTEFRVCRASGAGNLAKLGLVLIYSAVTDASAIESYLNARGAIV